MLTLVIGGARSGKSRFAQALARSLSERPVYLATSRAWDADHAARIARHRADRGPEWTTIEEETAPSRRAVAGRVVVMDCVTLWLTNLFADHGAEGELALGLAKEEVARMLAVRTRWIVVTNELGLGPHAATELGRHFVDAQGFLNQELAARADRAALMIAGLPLWLKGSAPAGL